MRTINKYLLILLLAAAPASTQAQTKEEQTALDLEHAGKTDEAIIAFNNIMKTSPTNANVLNELASCYYDKGDYAASYKAAVDARKLNKDEPRFIIAQARAAMEIDKADETISLTEQLVAKDPTMAYAYILRGQALEQKEQLQQAIGAYSKSIQTDSTMVVAYKLRGMAFYYISRYNDALKDLNKFISVDQTSSTAYNMRGLTWYRIKRNSEATADFTKSIALAPDNYTALNNRGTLYISDKQTALAKADFQKSMELNSNFAENYYGMARVYYNEKAFDKALPMIEKAIALNGTMEPYHATCCKILMALNRDKDAVTEADKLLAMNANNTDAWILKATAQSNDKDYRTAIKTMTAAIAKIPDTELFYGLRAAIYRLDGNNTAADADDNYAKRNIGWK